MTEFETSKNEHSATLLDDAALDIVVGGSDSFFQTYIDQHAVGGWTMRDVFAKPVLGQYIPR